MLRFLSEASGTESLVDIILSSAVDRSTYTIGRALSSDLVIALPRLSREHCRFILNNCGNWFIEDTSSTGTWVNDSKLSKNVPLVLRDNDVIKLSEDCLVYQFKSFVDTSACVSSNNSPKNTKDGGLCVNEKKPLSQLSSNGYRNIKENGTHDGYVPESQLKVLAAEEAEKRKRLEQTLASDLQVQKEKYEEELKTLTLKLEQAEQSRTHFKRNQDEWNNEKKLLRNNLEKQQRLLDKVKSETTAQVVCQEKEKEEYLQKKVKKELLFARKQEEWKHEREFLTYDIEKRKFEIDKVRSDHAQQLEEEREKMDHIIAKWEEENTVLKKLSDDLNHNLNEKTEELRLLTGKYNVQIIEKEAMQVENNLLLVEKKRIECEKDVLKEQLECSFSEKEALSKERDKLVQQVCDVQSRLSEATMARQANKLQVQTLEELMENELQCAICTEIVVDSRTLVCGHTFCHVCISEWLKKNPHCPNCRKKIKHTHPSKFLDGFIGKMTDNLSSPFKRKREQIVSEKVEVAACKQLRLSDFQAPEAYIDLTVTPFDHGNVVHELL